VNKSEQINELATALAKAQGAMTFASKDTTNPFYGKKYADLANVLEALRKPLSENSLSIVQGPEHSTDHSTVSVTTLLMHASGQWIETVLTLPVVREKKGEGFVIANDPQAVGSAITYARRYAAAAMAGITQDDDDANSASGKPQQPPKQKIEPKNGNGKAPPPKQKLEPKNGNGKAPPQTRPHRWEDYTEAEKIAFTEKRIEESKGNHAELTKIGLRFKEPNVFKGVTEENQKYLAGKLLEAMDACEPIQDKP